MEEVGLIIYKVADRTATEMAKSTIIVADEKELIGSILYHVQGMTTELIRYEEVRNLRENFIQT